MKNTTGPRRPATWTDLAGVPPGSKNERPLARLDATAEEWLALTDEERDIAFYINVNAFRRGIRRPGARPPTIEHIEWDHSRWTIGSLTTTEIEDFGDEALRLRRAADAAMKLSSFLRRELARRSDEKLYTPAPVRDPDRAQKLEELSGELRDAVHTALRWHSGEEIKARISADGMREEWTSLGYEWSVGRVLAPLQLAMNELSYPPDIWPLPESWGPREVDFIVTLEVNLDRVSSLFCYLACVEGETRPGPKDRAATRDLLRWARRIQVPDSELAPRAERVLARAPADADVVYRLLRVGFDAEHNPSTLEGRVQILLQHFTNVRRERKKK
jgi:hypothetical protein